MYCHVGKCMFGMCRHVGKCMYFMCRHVGKSMFNTSAMSEKVCTSCVTMSEKVCSTLLPCQTINFRQIRHVGNEFTTDVLHIRLIKISPQTYHGLHFSLSPCTYVGAKSRQCRHIMSEAVDDVESCIRHSAKMFLGRFVKNEYLIIKYLKRYLTRIYN